MISIDADDDVAVPQHVHHHHMVATLYDFLSETAMREYGNIFLIAIKDTI